MTQSIGFPSVDHVIRIHQRMIEDFGGSFGLRDRALLESAVAMPSASFGGQFLHRGVPAMAAALLFHLCKNHPFVDGNKRVALASSLSLLFANNHELTADRQTVEDLVLAVAAGQIDKDGVTGFSASMRSLRPQIRECSKSRAGEDCVAGDG